jgi:hypothetical protein
MRFDIYIIAHKQKKITKQSQYNMKFCNMCFKAGKSEKEYTSHWLRDRPGPSGVVVCPYLLSIECRYCHAKGHTVTRCPILANKNKQIKKSHASSVLPPLGTPPPLVMPQKKVKVEVVEPLLPLGTPPPLVMPQKKVKVEVVEPEPLVLAKSDEQILGKRKFTPKMSWADMCDSDEDDDEF